MAAKSKMASKTYVFVLMLSKAQFLPDFKILFCIRSVFWYLTFVDFFFGNQNGGLVQDGVIFFGKNRLFFERVLPT
jgi:hypothetical protein